MTPFTCVLRLNVFAQSVTHTKYKSNIFLLKADNDLLTVRYENVLNMHAMITIMLIQCIREELHQRKLNESAPNIG